MRQAFLTGSLSCSKLHCVRNYIHMNLFASFILKSISVLVVDTLLKTHFSRTIDNNSVVLWLSHEVTLLHTVSLHIPCSPSLSQYPKVVGNHAAPGHTYLLQPTYIFHWSGLHGRANSSHINHQVIRGSKKAFRAIPHVKFSLNCLMP